MIHLYAFARGSLGVMVRGIDDAVVTTTEVGDLRAVVSHHPTRLRASADAALEHVAAIEAAAEHADVVPVRFGPGHTDVDALRHKLDAVLPELHHLLDLVGGHNEFVVRPAVMCEPAGAPRGGTERTVGGPGRAYLERRRQEDRASAEQRAAVRDQLLEATQPLVDEAAAVHDVVSNRGPERCFLVGRTQASAFGAHARALVGRSGSFVVGGPWPPFTFASLPSHPEVGR